MEKVGTLNERDIQEQNKLQICRTLIADGSDQGSRQIYVKFKTAFQ